MAEASPDHQHWFEPIAAHLGSAYLRYSFTKGTRQEVDFLMRALQLLSLIHISEPTRPY